MKVLHIATSDSGGAGIAALRLHLGLLDAGVASNMLCLDVANSNNPNVFKFNRLDSPILTRLLSKVGLHKTAKQKNKEIFESLKDSEYDIYSPPYSDINLNTHQLILEADLIHLHWISGFIDYNTFFRTINKPIIWYLHDFNPLMGGFHLIQDLAKNKQKSITNVEDALLNMKRDLYRPHNITFIANSNSTFSLARKLTQDHPIQLECIPLSVDSNKFRALDKDACKKVLDIDTSKIWISFGAAGVLNKNKGILLLIEALKSIQSKGYSVGIICFGGNSAEISKQLTGIDFKLFPPIKSEEFLNIIYAASDLYVLPSLEETYGMVAVEAMSSGTPVVGFPVGILPELIIEGKNGYLAKLGDVSDLALKITDFINSKDQVRMGEYARNTVVEKCSVSAQATKFIALYKEVLNLKQ
ncbi:glycosyltransferase [Gelidibacter salicanalis]|uniref:Glycosyltransferase n=1 Tax=Gelidibacter salicanalis TaxID=291193 RepID=A0A934KNC7_9FLAO|nr:glycosyltransferase [Gelidibacter salicanalis]MBJ7879170.1 glycosyltransferase [Gelidibacter salicanalis]